jgi:hypothetical protein
MYRILDLDKEILNDFYRRIIGAIDVWYYKSITNTGHIGVTNVSDRGKIIYKNRILSKLADREHIQNQGIREEMYAIYYSTQMKKGNIFDINKQTVDEIVNAYLNGDKSFSVSGDPYIFSPPVTLKIAKIENNERLNSIRKDTESYSKFGPIRYIRFEKLKMYGTDVTYELIGNKSFGDMKQENNQTKNTIINNGNSVIIQNVHNAKDLNITVNNTNTKTLDDYKKEYAEMNEDDAKKELERMNNLIKEKTPDSQTEAG